jgi:hypothetical protein
VLVMVLMLPVLRVWLSALGRHWLSTPIEDMVLSI